jgi:hypothetical protein
MHGVYKTDHSQTEQVGTSNHSHKKPQSEIIQAEVIANNVGAEENKNMEDGDGTATSVNKENNSEEIGRKETSVNKKNESKESFKTEPSVVKEMSPKIVIVQDHLEDVGTTPSEKIDNVLEEGDGTEPSVDQ